MKAGEFSELVKLYRPSPVLTDYGSMSDELVYVGMYRARVIYGKGWRSVSGDEVVYSKSVYFTMRHYATVYDTDVVEYGKDRYRIVAIERRKAEQCIELTCELIND